MKVTLNKNIKLNSAQVYLRFQKEELRKDLENAGIIKGLSAGF
jgi:hypothetical protein